MSGDNSCLLWPIFPEFLHSLSIDISKVLPYDFNYQMYFLIPHRRCRDEVYGRRWSWRNKTWNRQYETSGMLNLNQSNPIFTKLKTVYHIFRLSWTNIMW